MGTVANEQRLVDAADRFRDAATGITTWEEALNGFADATGTRTGQLIAIGRDSLVPLNIMTRMPDESAREFLEVGGGSPEVNSRVRIGGAAPEMKFLDQADFDVEGDRRRSPEFGEWIDRYDIGYTCITTLVKQPDMLIGFAALRSKAQGWMRDEEKRAFMTLAGHARASVNLALAVEGQQAKSVAAAVECMSMVTLIFDGAGRLIAMSPKGESAVSSGWLGRLVDGVFAPHKTHERDRFNSRLSQAILARHIPAIAPPRPTVITTPDGERLIAEFVPLPNDSGFRFSATVMVVLRGLRGGSGRRTSQVARELFGLTDAEEQVASGLLRGQSPSEIAVATGRTVGTVRNHVHRILSKSACTSQVEFLGLMAAFD